MLYFQKLSSSKSSDVAPPSVPHSSSSSSTISAPNTAEKIKRKDSYTNKKERSLTPPPVKQRRSRTRSPVTSESSRNPTEQTDVTPDAKLELDSKTNATNKDKEKRPEWDMFADQDVDSNFDVSRWLVNFIQILKKRKKLKTEFLSTKLYILWPGKIFCLC